MPKAVNKHCSVWDTEATLLLTILLMERALVSRARANKVPRILHFRRNLGLT